MDERRRRRPRRRADGIVPRSRICRSESTPNRPSLQSSSGRPAASGTHAEVGLRVDGAGERARQQVAPRVAARLAARLISAGPHLLLDPRVVARQAIEPAGAPAVDPAVADVRRSSRPAPALARPLASRLEQHRRDGGRHALPAAGRPRSRSRMRVLARCSAQFRRLPSTPSAGWYSNGQVRLARSRPSSRRPPARWRRPRRATPPRPAA